jgi:hypothetical protein
MPFQLVAPIEKKFLLARTDEKYKNEGDPTFVTIKQAAQEEAEQRAQILSEVTRVVEQRRSNSVIKVSQNWSFELLKKWEVYLTLVECNIRNEDGTSLFNFQKKGRGLDMNIDDFSKAWGRLFPDIADEIHEKVMEVNVDWSLEG